MKKYLLGVLVSAALVAGVSHCTGGNTGGAVNPWLSYGPDQRLYMTGLGADVAQHKRGIIRG